MTPSGGGKQPTVGSLALSQAALDILAERQRQIADEGWTLAHDDQHRDGELALAAACYAAQQPVWRRYYSVIRGYQYAFLWPWRAEFWKPKDRRRNLVRAGALILADLERLDRVEGAGADVLPASDLGPLISGARR